MIIGQFCDTFPPELDGVGMVVKNYATELTRRGDECYMIAPKVSGYDVGTLPFDLIQYTGVKVPMAHQYTVGVPVLDIKYLVNLDSVHMQILHAHSPFAAGMEAVRIAKRYKIPLIGTFHSKYYDDFYQATHSELLANAGVKIVLNFYNSCDEVWTVTHAAADVLREYGYKGDITVMPNGTDLWYPTEDDKKDAQEKFSLGRGDVLLFVGQQHWKKNIRHIVEATKLYRKRGRPFKVVMVGQGPNEKEIKALVEELGLSDSYVFTGQVMDRHLLMSLYARANILVFPSLYDTAGLVVKEAAAAGTPSVVVRGSCAAEVISENENGFLCEDTPESIEETLYRALSTPELLHKCAENARETIPLKWSTVIDTVCERYRNLIDRFEHENR